MFDFMLRPVNVFLDCVSEQPHSLVFPSLVMESPSAEEVIDAFTEVLKDQLGAGNSVEVPSLGTFSVEHRPSEVEKEDSVRRLVPPQNEVAFTPEQDE